MKSVTHRIVVAVDGGGSACRAVADDLDGNALGLAKGLIGGAVAGLQNVLEAREARETRSCGALCLLGWLAPFCKSQPKSDFQSLCNDTVGDAQPGPVSPAQIELTGAGA